MLLATLTDNADLRVVIRAHIYILAIIRCPPAALFGKALPLVASPIQGMQAPRIKASLLHKSDVRKMLRFAARRIVAYSLFSYCRS
jgi:hypothetical protein